ncbi:MAG: hypothetical protein ACLP50_19030 [Solirubrobacteraceae bacterium]
MVAVDGLTGIDERRIDPAILDRSALVELPVLRDGEVELVGRGDGVG